MPYGGEAQAGGYGLMKGLLAYAIGGLLISGGAGGLGTIVIFLGIVAHWKYWLAGILAFFIGVYST